MSIALGYMDDDDEPIIVFTDAEKRAIPNADEALDILVSAAKRCYRLLRQKYPRMSEADFRTLYVHANYRAFLLSQRDDHQANFDGGIIYPQSEDILPILRKAYRQCCSIWDSSTLDPVIEAHAILDEIGDKMYPARFDWDDQ